MIEASCRIRIGKITDLAHPSLLSKKVDFFVWKPFNKNKKKQSNCCEKINKIKKKLLRNASGSHLHFSSPNCRFFCSPTFLSAMRSQPTSSILMNSFTSPSDPKVINHNNIQIAFSLRLAWLIYDQVWSVFFFLIFIYLNLNLQAYFCIN